MLDINGRLLVRRRGIVLARRYGPVRCHYILFSLLIISVTLTGLDARGGTPRSPLGAIELAVLEIFAHPRPAVTFVVLDVLFFY